VFVLQHKFKKWVYWGTAWDLFEAQREQLELVRMNIHPDPRMNNHPDPEHVEFVVVREVPMPMTFQLDDFEAELQKVLKLEFYRQRRMYCDRVVWLYKKARLRCGLTRIPR
jgi:hypothetical protein